MLKICGTCAFARPVERDEEAPETHQCRRGHPRDASERWAAEWPRVVSADWCGDWSAER